MSLTTLENRKQYSGNGSVKTFSFPYYFLENADLVVVVTSPLGEPSTKVLDTDYTVSGAGNPAGGAVVFGAAPPNHSVVTIYRSPVLTQDLSITPHGPFPSGEVEKRFDKLTMIVQRFYEMLKRSVSLPEAETETFNPQLPELQPGQVLAINEDRTGFQGGPTVTELTDAMSSTEGVAADLVAHVADTGNPHAVTASQIGGNGIVAEVNATPGVSFPWNKISKLGSSLADLVTRDHSDLTGIGTKTHAEIDSHVADAANPHSVTAAQVGKDVAQWNASKIIGKTVDGAALGDQKVLTYDLALDKFFFSAAGVGLIAGGTTGQLLKKHSNGDFDVEWVDPPNSAVWGGISGLLSDQTDLATALGGKVATTDVSTAADANKIAKRDGLGKLSATLFVGDLDGQATFAGTAVDFTGSLAGDVQGTQNATEVRGILGCPVDDTTLNLGWAMVVGAAGTYTHVQQIPMSYLDTDTSLTGNSDAKVASQKATRSYIGTKTAAVGYSTQNFTGTSFTTTADRFQRHRYTGVSAQTMTAPTLTLIPDGAMVVLIGTSDTNTITVPEGLAGIVKLKGPIELGLGNTLTLMHDATLGGLCEISRS